jgi:SAM-dependent methyltransferase
MSDPTKVRSQVSEAYTDAINKATGCCGPTCCGPTQYYDPAVLGDLPTTPSFGCGDPLAFTEVQPGQTVVDLGSGAGLDLLVAAKTVGPTGHVIGIDMTDAMIEVARKNAASAGFSQVEVRKGIIEDLPVEENTVDWVISNCVINLSPEKDRVFSEIARVLKPDGHMLVSDIVAEDLPAWVRESPFLTNACIGGAISEEAYLAGLEAAGLVDVEVVEKVTYTSEALLESLKSDFPQLGGAAEVIWKEVGPQLEGKVHSIRVRARKA